MIPYRTIAQAALIGLVSLNVRLAASQVPLNDPGQCKPRKGAQYSASQESTDMYAVLVPAGDSGDASAMYLATLLQEVQTAFIAPDTVRKLSDGVMSLWLHADGRLIDPRPADTLLPPEVAAALSAAIDSVTRRGWLGPVLPPLRTDSVALLLMVHYPDERTPLSVPLFRVTSPPAYSEFQVEKPALLQYGSPSPTYPKGLRELNLEGEVLAEFVVSQTGRAEMRTYRVVKATHAEFAAAVQAVLPRMRFHPAELNGCPVRQRVYVPFAFKLNWSPALP